MTRQTWWSGEKRADSACRVRMRGMNDSEGALGEEAGQVREEKRKAYRREMGCHILVLYDWPTEREDDLHFSLPPPSLVQKALLSSPPPSPPRQPLLSH